MTVFPIIARELRVAGRQGRTYWLRLVAGALLLAGMMAWGFSGPRANDGISVFAALHYCVFLVLWLFVSIMTADCLSRERREGTLGLLFLTPLSAQDVVTAKVMTHALRALTLWLAAVPMLAVPLLMGGVGATSVLASVALNFAVLLLALTAGLVSSVLMTRWTAATVVALLLSGVGFFAFLGGIVWGIIVVEDDPQISISDLFDAAYEITLTGPGTWADFFRELQSNRRNSLTAAVLGALWVAGTLFILGIGFTVRRLGRSWRILEKPRIVARAQHALTTPIFATAYLRRRQHRMLERNPIGWLQYRRWTGRMLAWAWLGATAVLASIMALKGGVWPNSGGPPVLACGWLLVATIGITAAASFLGEKQTGFLELLLVTPLTGGQILWGRLRGIWSQFWPAIGVLFAVWVYLGTLFSINWWEPMALAPMLVTLPIIGFYYSLGSRTVTTAIAATLVVGMMLPWLFATAIMVVVGLWGTDEIWMIFDLPHLRLPGFSQSFGYADRYVVALSMGTAVFQAGIAAIALKRSLRLLNTRTFASLRQ